jgi:hypothetical protein
MTPFDGDTYDRRQDQGRLLSQLARVRRALLSNRGFWFTLADLSKIAEASEASVSARMRDLRKRKFNSYTIERRRVPGGNGLHEYRMPPRIDVQAELF